MCGSRACHVLRCRGWFYTQRHALWSESEICVVCHLNFIRPQPYAVLSYAIDLYGSLGVREKGVGCQCVGVTSVSKQPGAHACVFDLASAKLAGALFHGQHVARGINKGK